MPMPPRSFRVAVIGAGAAGLAAARELRREGHTPVVFERAHNVGGTWLYDSSSSSLYASLRTNLPREVMGFLDFPFVAGPDSVDPRRFPRHQEVLRYIQAFARRFHLHGMLRLRTEVIAVTVNQHQHLQLQDDEIIDEATTGTGTTNGGGSGRKWKVKWRRNLHLLDDHHADADADATAEQEQEEVFDAVVICNGHYTEPRTADIPGVDAWLGKQMHNHSYRVPDPFAGQVVVIVGASNSGADISRDIAGVAKEVHVANRSYMTSSSMSPDPAAAAADVTSASTCCQIRVCRLLPGYHNIWLHSMVERAEEDGTVVFRDGSSVRADVIMHCTGYKYSFPFLKLPLQDADTLAVVVSVDDNRIHPLYKHVFVPQVAPHLAFIGLPFKVTPFPMLQLQAIWVAGALSGRIQLPSEKEMMEDVQALYSELEATGWPVRYTHCMKHNQFEYDGWLAEQMLGAGSRVRVEEWRKDMFEAARRNKVECPETYRDEWDDHHLLEQAYQHFSKYSSSSSMASSYSS